MLTPFGKFSRKLRIDNGELLKDMAGKLGVTSSYLSAVENGKRNAPHEWIDKISDLYSLSPEDRNDLMQAVQASQKVVKIDFEGISSEDRNAILALAREFKSLDEGDKEKIKNILLKNKKRRG
ncbi:transcriptional regulator xre family, bacteriophage lambda repressor c1 like protein [Bacillus methanolicus PB1]|uniref:Transcriptional regulator xre family, bacteriophage lambda repressor c1 like protein n=1 Tax=Bacillus methanolicus PB1 TaxID=997296 RepID=I3DXX7_BACMT|nr:helix-turn-helix domain-containing protein [Bacillus methanolicus]EIJ79098.1 transcriptional regulator xre family, bacteriophage lambda repressor c1 like protein [Bacillus methanolicus PB1]